MPRSNRFATLRAGLKRKDSKPGPCEGDDLLQELGGEEICYSAGDQEGLKRLRRLSRRRWAKWFFTDEAGNPILVCAGELSKY